MIRLITLALMVGALLYTGPAQAQIVLDINIEYGLQWTPPSNPEYGINRYCLYDTTLAPNALIYCTVGGETSATLDDVGIMAPGAYCVAVASELDIGGGGWFSPPSNPLCFTMADPADENSPPLTIVDPNDNTPGRPVIQVLVNVGG